MEYIPCLNKHRQGVVLYQLMLPFFLGQLLEKLQHTHLDLRQQQQPLFVCFVSIKYSYLRFCGLFKMFESETINAAPAAPSTTL